MPSGAELSICFSTSGADALPASGKGSVGNTAGRRSNNGRAGADVVVLFDGLTRLARAYSQQGNYRMQSGDIRAAAVGATLRFFAGARNLEDDGSITMLATARAASSADQQAGVTAATDLASFDWVVAERLREVATAQIDLAPSKSNKGQLDFLESPTSHSTVNFG